MDGVGEEYKAVMSTPLVSVKMLTYNHAPYIERAIEGVLGQETDFPFELVIGEDCSTDGTRNIVLDYAARYPHLIRVVTSDSNVGMHRNGDRTSAALRGKYVAWCEGDDYWHRRDKLQIQVNYLEGHPDCGLVYADCDWYLIEEKRLIPAYSSSSKKTPAGPVGIEDIVSKRVDIRTCTVMAIRELVDEVVASDRYLFSDVFRMGDTQLWAEVSLRTHIHYLNVPLAVYQVHDDSATRCTTRASGLRFTVSDAQMYLYLCEKHGLSAELRVQHLEKYRRAMLQLAFVEHRTDLADEVRNSVGSFSLKDWVWYWGVRFALLRPLVSVLYDRSRCHTRKLVAIRNV